MRKRKNEIEKQEVKKQEKNCLNSHFSLKHFCPLCGHKIREELKYCWNCGYCLSCD